MDQATCEHYLRLLHSEQVSTALFARLLKEFGSMQALVAVESSTLEAIGVAKAQIDALRSAGGNGGAARNVEVAMEWSSKRGHHLLCYESASYPALLREIDAPPPLLFLRGCPADLSARMVAIVGSRKASIYGRRNARWIAERLAGVGLHISSGLANGIDTEAHEGALEGAGKTIAVMGTGIDRIYPRRNRALAERIADNGALLSEFPLGVPPYASNFPRRNRIISGLAEGTVVVEGHIKSGSLITARLAMEQNRDVFALPGPIGNSSSRGCHQLIKQGAKLVEEPQDILDELGVSEVAANGGAQGQLSGDMKPGEARKKARVLEAIDWQGCTLESILARGSLELQELNAELIELEAAGLIHTEGGRYYKNPE